MQVALTTGPFSGILQGGEAELISEAERRGGKTIRINLTTTPTISDLAPGRYALRRLFLHIEKYQYEFLLYPYGNKPAYPLVLAEKQTSLNLLPKVKFDLYVGGARRRGESLYPRLTLQTENGMTLASLLPPKITREINETNATSATSAIGEAHASILLQDSAQNTPHTLDTDTVRFT